MGEGYQETWEITSQCHRGLLNGSKPLKKSSVAYFFAKFVVPILTSGGQERFSFDIIAACIQKDKGFLEIINVVQYGSSSCLDSFRNHASTDITGRKRIADIVQQECKDIT